MVFAQVEKRWWRRSRLEKLSKFASAETKQPDKNLKRSTNRNSNKSSNSSSNDNNSYGSNGDRQFQGGPGGILPNAGQKWQSNRGISFETVVWNKLGILLVFSRATGAEAAPSLSET